MYPWASIGGFLFKRSESPVYGTDIGWIQTPIYVRQTPLGSGGDTIVTTALGSMERGFEIYIADDRFAILKAMANAAYLFTDWTKPTPDSRQAFLSSVVQQDIGMHGTPDGNRTYKVSRVKISLLSV
jgi:hypothetical protein